jgi:DNA-binding PadR family transcriptional regulator
MALPRSPEVSELLPLKPVVFQILLALTQGERHGWSIVKELDKGMAGGKKILPGNLYRTLKTMLAQGLIEQSEARPDPELDDERRRYFRLSEFGAEVARAEADRMEQMVIAARSADLLSAPSQRQ